MRKSRGITVTLLSGLVLTAGLSSGCSRQPDRTWYDAQGHVVAENWKTDATGKRIPDPFPYDRYGRQWVYDANGVLMPLPPPGRTSRSTSWLWGSSGYRSTSSGTSYRSDSWSSSSSSGSSSSSASSSSVSRGGFGSTGLSGG